MVGKVIRSNGREAAADPAAFEDYDCNLEEGTPDWILETRRISMERGELDRAYFNEDGTVKDPSAS